MTKILILGGTREAAALAGKLVDEGHDVTTSLAGRTREPEPLAGKTRIGGFGGIEGLAEYIRHEGVEKLIDATHPFAKQISANAEAAAETAGIPLETLTRPPWKKQSGDNWLEAVDLDEACRRIPSGARVLLALGSQHIDLFKSRTDVFFLVRMVDEPGEMLPLPSHELLIAKPGLRWQDERDVLQKFAITHIICRNSGGTGAYAKIEAARELGLPVIMINR